MRLAQKSLEVLRFVLQLMVFVGFKKIYDAQDKLFLGLGKDLNLRLTQRANSEILFDQNC